MLALLWLLNAISGTIHAAGSIHYVAPGGSNTTDCTNSASPCATIQYAVEQADADAEVHIATGVHTDVHLYPRNDLTTTGFVTQVVFISRNITLRGGFPASFSAPADPEATPTILDAQRKGRGLYIVGNISATIEGLHITGGSLDALGGRNGYACGGGVLVMTATVVFRSNRVFSNTGDGDGAGLCLFSSNARFISNSISNNTLAGYGGGIGIVNSAVAFINNTFAFNQGGYGGGLYQERSSTTLSGNVFISNVAFWGGGLYIFGHTSLLTGNAIISNVSQGTSFEDGGGGMHIEYANVGLYRNTVVGNVAGYGGGGLRFISSIASLDANTIISNTTLKRGGGRMFLSGNAVLTNTIIAENQAGFAGSGLYLDEASLHLLHNTFARNRGGDGSGIHVSSGRITLTKCRAG